jgi:HEAT repeat protein
MRHTLALACFMRLSITVYAADSATLVKGLLSSSPQIQAEYRAQLTSLSDTQRKLVVTELVTALRKDAVSAEKAATALGELGVGAKEASTALTEALVYDESSVAEACLKALAKMPAQTAVPPLQRALEHPNFLVRQRAAKGLASFGAEAKKAAPALIQLLKDPRSEVHLAAGDALLKMGDAATPAFRTALKRENGPERRVILASFARLGPAASSELLSRLKDENAGVRVSAADALGEMRKPQPIVIEALATTLKDLDDSVRIAAATSLARLGPSAKSAIGALIVCSLSDSDSLVRARAIEALQAIGTPGPESVPGLVANFKNDNVDIRRRLARAFVEAPLSASDASSFAASAFKDSDPLVRLTALQAIPKLNANDAIAVVRLAMVDPETNIRLGALGQIPKLAPGTVHALQPDFLEVLKDRNFAVRHQMIQSLGALGGPGASALVQSITDLSLGDAATRALMKIGEPAKPALTTALQDPDPGIRKNAQNILNRMTPKKATPKSRQTRKKGR